MSRSVIKAHKAKVIELAVKHGLTAQCIAERYGCGRQTVASFLRRNGYVWDRDGYRWVPQMHQISSNGSSSSSMMMSSSSGTKKKLTKL